MDFPGTSPVGSLLDQAAAGADEARVRRLGSQATRPVSTPADREALAKSAREFEAVFMNTLLKAMRKTVPDDKLFNGGGSTKFYREMHDAELARAMSTGRSGMGIADLIIQQFSSPAEPGEDGLPGDAALTGRGPVPLPAAASRQRPRPAPGIVPAPGPEVLGPPAPLPPAPASPVLTSVSVPPPAPGALARYRTMGPVGQQAAEAARLRNAARAQGPAVADTLHRFEREINTAANDSGLQPSLILAVVMEESGGNPQARSPKGATGLMQLMPGTAADLGVRDSTSPAQNLNGGAEYLARMLRRYEGRLDLALAAYNAGPGNVDRAGKQIPQFAETQRYVRRVMARHEELGGGTDLANGNPGP